MQTITKWHITNLGLILPNKETNNGAQTLEAAMDEILDLRAQLIKEQKRFNTLMSTILECQRCCTSVSDTNAKQLLEAKLLDMINKKD